MRGKCAESTMPDTYEGLEAWVAGRRVAFEAEQREVEESLGDNSFAARIYKERSEIWIEADKALLKQARGYME